LCTLLSLQRDVIAVANFPLLLPTPTCEYCTKYLQCCISPTYSTVLWPFEVYTLSQSFCQFKSTTQFSLSVSPLTWCLWVAYIQSTNLFCILLLSLEIQASNHHDVSVLNHTQTKFQIWTWKFPALKIQITCHILGFYFTWIIQFYRWNDLW